MIRLPPRGTDARHLFVRRALNDTGFFCRNVLGMDTDRDPTTKVQSDEGKGGIRDHGPHEEITNALDDRSVQYSVTWAPRFIYKSSRAEGFITRNILHPDQPNISILSVMATKEAASERVDKVRHILTENPIITELYGDLRGPMWRQDRFITRLRTDKGIFSPTLSSASPQVGLAGGRYDLVVVDDITNELTISEVQLAKGKKFLESALALQGRNTLYRMIATPWDEEDASHWAIRMGWKACTHLDAGVEVIRLDDGTIDIKGSEQFPNGRWPNLPVEFLRRYAKGGISFETFMSQFMLRCVKGSAPNFSRAQFHPVAWNDGMRELTAYLLCDTAPRGSPGGDLNVLMMVGIDPRGSVFILDCEVGYWTMYDFVEKYLEMIARWSGRVMYRGEVWEEGKDYLSYAEHIGVRARSRGIRSQILHAEKRNQTSLGKDVRIPKTSFRFQAGQVHVVNTVPRAWSDGMKLLPLWEPEGFYDIETKTSLPGGELVEQFVRYPNHPKKDIPDCFSLVDSVDKKLKTPVCCHVPSTQNRIPDEVMRDTQDDRQYTSLGSYDRFLERCYRP